MKLSEIAHSGKPEHNQNVSSSLQPGEAQAPIPSRQERLMKDFSKTLDKIAAHVSSQHFDFITELSTLAPALTAPPPILQARRQDLRAKSIASPSQGTQSDATEKSPQDSTEAAETSIPDSPMVSKATPKQTEGKEQAEEKPQQPIQTVAETPRPEAEAESEPESEPESASIEMVPTAAATESTPEPVPPAETMLPPDYSEAEIDPEVPVAAETVATNESVATAAAGQAKEAVPVAKTSQTEKSEPQPEGLEAISEATEDRADPNQEARTAKLAALLQKEGAAVPMEAKAAKNAAEPPPYFDLNLSRQSATETAQHKDLAARFLAAMRESLPPEGAEADARRRSATPALIQFIDRLSAQTMPLRSAQELILGSLALPNGLSQGFTASASNTGMPLPATAQALVDAAKSPSAPAPAADSPSKAMPRTAAANTMERVEAALKEVARARDGKSLMVRLDPPSLGQVKVDVTLRDGLLHARLLAESPQVTQLLRERCQDLQSLLRRLGLQVDKVSVAVGNEEGPRSQEQAFNQRRRPNLRNAGPSQASPTPVAELVKPPTTAVLEDHWIA